MQLPSDHEIELLHRNYAQTDNVFAVVWQHCRIVRDIADQLMARRPLSVDERLVQVGSLLHDVGVYALYNTDGTERGADYVTHGIRGEALLRAAGFPKEIWRFASHHTGVGLTKQDIIGQGLGLPARSFAAETTEEQLVMYADKFHSKTEPPTFNSYDWYETYVGKFGVEKVQKFQLLAAQFGSPVLDQLAEDYGQLIR